ncbi:heavy metal translocating P-type ATPase [Bifidobacterium sp.]|jgi:heavy metal translocating P-type ATPase|uniref:heavy metal translocating P-type ATPase n=1 Tax=Bifidobacterium sp. TaxID=41200 RepID=UPI0025B7EE4E|nr:cation-translocating P-type ATPase [Bifidobacterium sp.]MCI1636249.1 cation-translocating P-type ATPase [Bifidobacterium sp.]
MNEAAENQIRHIDESTAQVERNGSRSSILSLLRRIEHEDLIRVLVCLALTAAVGLLDLFQDVSTVMVPLIIGLTIVGLIVGCWPIVKESWEDIRAKKMSMDLSMLIAIVAAAAIGQWLTSLVIVVFVLLAEILEDLCMDQGEDALSDLMSFLPHQVRVRVSEFEQKDIPLSEVQIGQVVIVSPGGRIPVDGEVVAGSSSVDESRITGESMPVALSVGSAVYSGSVNQDGALEISVSKVGEDSSFGRIITALKDAQSSSAPVQRLADTLATALVLIAVAGAVLTWIVTQDIRSAISVVIVAGSCGVVAGTPLAMLASMARVARTGAFVKDGLHMESLSGIDTVIFDKTGTLTKGTPEVTQVLAEPDIDESVLLGIASSAESYSEHPLGKAIVEYANAHGIKPIHAEHFESTAGRGVRCSINGQIVTVGTEAFMPQRVRESIATLTSTSLQSSTSAPSTANSADRTVVQSAVHIACDEHYLGSIMLADAPRTSAASCIAELHRQGIRVVMLTGDRTQVAEEIAKQLGIDHVHAELLPEDKATALKRQREAGHRIAMVGDGVNDAPVLALADVGIAMGSGTDIARESADVVLISSDLNDVASLLHTARRARRIIMCNFVGTIVVDAIGMLLAAFGILTPLFSAIVHVGSESAFILNSARLIPRRHHSIPDVQ